MRTLSVFLFFAAVAVSSSDPGHVNYERQAKPDLDPYTNSPASAQQQWFRTHFSRMVVFSPYFDKRTSWFPNSLVYIDLYGLPVESLVVRDHPDWVLRDSAGARLYIPWGCAHGTCPQYAADVASPAFRSWWINRAHSILSHHYRGIFIDDVNTEFRVSDGNARQVPPIDSTSGKPMSWEAWRGHIADFVEQIRAAFPKIEIVHNSIWFAGPPGVRDRDPAIERQIKAADNINVERGIANDPGLTGGMGEWSVYELFSYIDRVHQMGRGVTFEEYELDAPKQAYALAGYFLISTGQDFLADVGASPVNWWSGYDVDLGNPAGPRTYDHGVFRRTFSCGLVLLGEPGLPKTKINLDAPFSTLDGRTVRSVEIAGRQGVILQSCRPEGH